MPPTSNERQPLGEIQPVAHGQGRHGCLPISAEEMEQRRHRQLTGSRIQRLVQVREQAKQLSQAQVKRYRQQVDHLTEERLGDMQHGWQRQKEAQLGALREECQQSLSKVGTGHGCAEDVLQEKLERNRLHMEAMAARNQAALERHSQALAEEGAKRNEQAAPFRSMMERKEHVKETEMQRALSMVAKFNQEMQERTAQRLEAERAERAAIARGMPSTFNYKYTRLHEVGVPALIQRHQEAGADGRGKGMADAVQQERTRAWENEQQRAAARVEAQDREEKRAALANLRIQMETNKRAVESELERIQKENQKAVAAAAASGVIKTRLLRDMETRAQQGRAERFFEQQVLQGMEEEGIQRHQANSQPDSAAAAAVSLDRREETGWPSDPNWIPLPDEKPQAKPSAPPQEGVPPVSQSSVKARPLNISDGASQPSAATNLKAEVAEDVAGIASETAGAGSSEKDPIAAPAVSLAGRDLTISDVMAASSGANPPTGTQPGNGSSDVSAAWEHMESQQSRIESNAAVMVETSGHLRMDTAQAKVVTGTAKKAKAAAAAARKGAPPGRKEVSPAPRLRVPRPTERRQVTPARAAGNPPVASAPGAARAPSSSKAAASARKQPAAAKKAAVKAQKGSGGVPTGRRPTAAPDGSLATASQLPAEPLPRNRKPRPPGPSQVPRVAKPRNAPQPSASAAPYVSAAVPPGRRAPNSVATAAVRPRASPLRHRPGTAVPGQRGPRETSRAIPVRARHSPAKKVAVARPPVSSVSSAVASGPTAWSLPSSGRKELGSIAELQAIQRELGLPVTLFGSEKDSASLSASSSEISGLTEMLRTSRAGVQAAVDRALERVAAASSASKTHTDITRPEPSSLGGSAASDYGAAFSVSLREETSSQPSATETDDGQHAASHENDTGDGFSLATDDIHRLQMDLQTSLYNAADAAEAGRRDPATSVGDISAASSSLEQPSGSTEALSAGGTDPLSWKSSTILEGSAVATGSVSGATGTSTYRSNVSLSTFRQASSTVPQVTSGSTQSRAEALEMDISMSTVTDTLGGRDVSSPSSSGFTGISSLVPEVEGPASPSPSTRPHRPAVLALTADGATLSKERAPDSPTSSVFTGLSSIIARQPDRLNESSPQEMTAQPSAPVPEPSASPTNSMASSALTGVTAVLRAHPVEEQHRPITPTAGVDIRSAAVSPTPAVLAQLSAALTQVAQDTGLYPGAGTTADTEAPRITTGARETHDLDSVIEDAAHEDTEWLMGTDRQTARSFSDLKTLEGSGRQEETPSRAESKLTQAADKSGVRGSDGYAGGSAVSRDSDDRSAASLAARLAAEQARQMLQVWANDNTDNSIASSSPASAGQAADREPLSPSPTPRSPLSRSSREKQPATVTATAYGTTAHGVSRASVVNQSISVASDDIRDDDSFTQTAAATRAITDEVLGEEGDAGTDDSRNDATAGFVSVTHVQQTSVTDISTGHIDDHRSATLNQSDGAAVSFSFGGVQVVDGDETVEMVESTAPSHPHSELLQGKRSRNDTSADGSFDAPPQRDLMLMTEDHGSLYSSLFSTPAETPIKPLETYSGWESPSSVASGSTAGMAEALHGLHGTVRQGFSSSGASKTLDSRQRESLEGSEPQSAGAVLQKTKSDVARRYAQKIAELEARSAEASARRQAARDAAHKATAGVQKLARSPEQSPTEASETR